MAKILMAGDSWGYGAGGYTSDFFKGKDVEFRTEMAFTEYDFTNVSFAGGDNDMSVNRIRESLTDEKYDYVFWIQTDPIRSMQPMLMKDIRNEEVDTRRKNRDTEFGPLSVRFLSQDGIDFFSSVKTTQYIEDKITDTYADLNKIALSSGTKIFCIGGCSMLCHTISRFDNLVPIIPSVIQFLIPEFKQDTMVFDSCWITGMIQYADTHKVNEMFASNLHEIVDTYFAKNTFAFGSSPYFNVDRTHPSPEGLLLWTTECKKYIR